MITKEEFCRGSGGGYRLTAPDSMADELETEVKATLKDIDFMRSPSIESRQKKDGQLTVTIKYYGLD